MSPNEVSLESQWEVRPSPDPLHEAFPAKQSCRVVAAASGFAAFSNAEKFNILYRRTPKVAVWTTIWAGTPSLRGSHGCHDVLKFAGDLEWQKP